MQTEARRYAHHAPRAPRYAAGMENHRDSRRPALSILDPRFRYKPSHETDVRETFERVRRELARSPAARLLPTLRLSRP
jgi:hypothetical protein